MHIALLHTAQVHVETFDGIFADIDSAIELAHHVAPDLLDRARSHGLASVRDEVLGAMGELVGADVVLLTCSTLGPLADESAFEGAIVLRIDRPLMHSACQHGPRPVVVICLESTRDATMALLTQTADELGIELDSKLLLCQNAWPYFEAGDQSGFAQVIASDVQMAVAAHDATCVVLAQASMRVAAPLLTHLRVPVLSSPELAAQQAVRLARAQTSS